MATKEELIKLANEKYERDQLIAQAEAKWAAENAPAKTGPSGLEQIETAGRSLLEGVSAGVSEPVVSGVNAVLGNLIDSGFEAESLKDFFSKSIDTARIESEFKRDVERRKGLEKALHGTAIAAELAGALAPVSAPAKIAKAAGIAVKGLESAPLLGPILKGAAEAGAATAAAEGLKQAVQEPTGFIEEGAAPAPSESAVTAAKFGAALGTLPVIGKAAKYAAPRVLSAFGGVSPKIISDYLKREAPIAPVSSEKLREAVEIAAQNVQDALSSQKNMTADDLITAVQSLKQKVISGSDEAFQILEQASASGADVAIPVASIEANVAKSLQDLRRGAKALTPVRESAAAALEDLLARFQSRAVDGKIDLVTAKEMIQAIDEVKNYAKDAGSFSSSLDLALGSLRSAIDEPLKAIKPYADKMKEVSDASRLLSQANDYFGDASKAFRNVDRLVLKKDPILNNTASKLEQATGIQINKGLESLNDLRPVQNILPDNAEVFVNQVMTGRSPLAQKRLGVLSQMADEDLVELANKAALTKEFGKLVQNGSRDVNFWKEVLGASGALGAVSGGILAGPVGAMTGATVGYMVKSYGAPATKLILDSMIKVRGYPTVQKLNQAMSSVSPEIRSRLIQGFVSATAGRFDDPNMQTINVAPEQAGAMYQEVKSSDIDATTKAKALESLSRNSTIDAQALKQVTIGVMPSRQAIVKPMSKEALKEDRPKALIKR